MKLKTYTSVQVWVEPSLEKHCKPWPKIIYIFDSDLLRPFQLKIIQGIKYV